MTRLRSTSLRNRLLLALSLPLAMMIFMGAISRESVVTRLEMAKAVSTLLSGPASGPDQDVTSLFSDLPASHGPELRKALERGLMQGYPDGSFRPDDPVRWAEWLQTWTKLLTVTRPDLSDTSTNSSWPQDDLNVLQRAEFPLPEAVRQKRFAARVSSDEFQSILSETRRVLRIALPEQSAQPAGPDTSAVTLDSPPPTSKTASTKLRADIAESLAPAVEPAEGFRLRGKLLDALTQKPVPDAQLIVDQKVVPVSPEGIFLIEGLRRQQIIEVFITADGYQSLSFKHRVGYKPFLQLLLKPYRASLHLRLVSAGTGEAVDGATVTLGDREVNADWTGKASITGLNPGYQKVLVSAPGFKQTSAVVFVEEKSSQRTIKMQPTVH